MPSCKLTNTTVADWFSINAEDGNATKTPTPDPVQRLRRFAFRVADGLSNKAKANRRREVFLYVDDWLDSAEIVDEWGDENTRWLVVALRAEISVAMAERFATWCPHYIAGSFEPD